MRKRMRISGKALIIISLLMLLPISFVQAQELKGQEITPETTSEETKEGIDVEFKGTDIHTVLRSFAAISGLNIIAGPEVGVPGGVNIKLTQVPWEKAFDVILRNYRLAYERDGNIIRVTTMENLETETLATRLFALNYAKATDVLESVKDMLSARGKIKSDNRTNLLIITDVSANLNKIEGVIKELDSMTPQVAIESKVIETNLTKDEKLGIRWSDFLSVNAPTESFTDPNTPAPSITYDVSSKKFTYGTLSAESMKVVLNMLQQRSKANVVANPTVTTLNNQPARIAIITKFPVAQYQVSSQTGVLTVSGYAYQEYGTILNVTPTVNKDGYITLEVHPQVSRESGTTAFQGSALPIVSSQETDTNVMVKDGETMVIAGLVKEDTVETRNKVPILGDIPLVGWVLFRDKRSEVKEKRDLVIFITPHIIKSSSDVYAKISQQPGHEGENKEVNVVKESEGKFTGKSIDELMEQLENKPANNKGYIYKK